MSEIKIGNYRFAFKIGAEAFNHKFQLFARYRRFFLKTTDKHRLDVCKIGLLQQCLKTAGKTGNADVARVFDKQNRVFGKRRPVGRAV